jgi:hypothetical protein
MRLRSGGLWFEASPGNYLVRPHLKNKTKQKTEQSWVPVAHACSPSYLGGTKQEDGGSKPGSVNKFVRLITKIPNKKQGFRVAQVVQRLPSKHEPLSSNSAPPKKKRESWKNYNLPITYLKVCRLWAAVRTEAS